MTMKWFGYVGVSVSLAFALVALGSRQTESASVSRLLYVASPGILDQVEHGGVGILVFDITNNHRFMRRIPTWPDGGGPVEKVKGVVASAATQMICVSTPTRVACFDLQSDEKLWEKQYEGGADRLAMTPDGATLYVPSHNGPHWRVVDARTGDVIKKLVADPDAGAHNTIVSLGGTFAYLGGMRSRWLYIVDTKKREIARKIGPFGNVIRPLTVNRSGSLCFVNVNDLLGFEVGDVRAGTVSHRVEIRGFPKGPTQRHGCPSHGIGLTPDETELWVCDSFNERVHIFDATVVPPKPLTSVKLRGQPGWITFSLDGRLAYPSTGDVIDVGTRKILTTLKDERGRAVQSEKMLEIDWADGKAVRVGDQFGLGRSYAIRRGGS